MLARKEGSPSMCNCGDGACTTQASYGCAPPGPATRRSPLRSDCAALRSPRAHGRTRSTACGRCAQTCGRESEGWARWRAAPAALCCSPPRLMPAPAGRSRRSQSRPRPGKRNRPHCKSRPGGGAFLLAMPRPLPRDPRALHRFRPH